MHRRHHKHRILSVSLISLGREASTSTASFELLNTSTGIPSPPGALSHFILEIHSNTSFSIGARTVSELRLFRGSSTLLFFANFRCRKLFHSFQAVFVGAPGRKRARIYAWGDPGSNSCHGLQLRLSLCRDPCALDLAQLTYMPKICL